MPEWRKRKHGTPNQIGQSFVVAPSRQKLKRGLPAIDVPDIRRISKEHHEKYMKEKGEKALERLGDLEAPEERKVEIERNIYAKYFPQEEKHIEELENKISEQRPKHWYNLLIKPKQ
jgi:hypothetical protein